MVFHIIGDLILMAYQRCCDSVQISQQLEIKTFKSFNISINVTYIVCHCVVDIVVYLKQLSVAQISALSNHKQFNVLVYHIAAP